MNKVLFSTLALSSLSIAAPARSVTVNGNSNPSSLVNTLLGSNSGITVVGTPTLTGATLASGTFTGGNDGSIGLDSGIVLSTGKATDAIGSYNGQDAIGTIFNTAGDAQLNQLFPGSNTGDAASLAFNFTSNTNDLYFLNYVFASQEYPRYVGSQFNDAFAFFIDDVNVATVPGTNQPVSINTINNGFNGTGNRPPAKVQERDIIDRNLTNRK
jgi:hypothetical protein